MRVELLQRIPQGDLFAIEPFCYQNVHAEGYFSILQILLANKTLSFEDLFGDLLEEKEEPRERVQVSYRVAELPYVLNNLDPEKDSYISQASFWKRNRRIVNLKSLGLLFADLDTYRMEGLRGKSASELTRGFLAFCEFQEIPEPSLVVFSGQGLQAKWILEGAIPRPALPRWQLVQRNLTERLLGFGADPAARDASRVLRIENTVNSKTGKKVHVEWAEGRIYNFEYLAEALLPKARWEVDRLVGEGGREPEARRILGLTRSLQDLNWARLEDLRTLRRLRGEHVSEGFRMKTLLWEMNFLALSKQVSSATFFHEAAALAHEIDPTWSYSSKQLGTVFRKVRQLEQGEEVEFMGQKVSPLYTPKNERLLELFEIEPEEEMHLSTIISESESYRRRTQKRRIEGRKGHGGELPRDAYLAITRRNDLREEAKKLRTQGHSLRAIANILELSLVRIQQLLE